MLSSRIGILALPLLGAFAGCNAEAEPAPECGDLLYDLYDEAALTADVTWLASPALDGRVPGTEGDEAARAAVEDRFACLGLTPLLASGEYQEPFTDAEGRETANVLASITGSDPSVADEVILLSAHVDHLGDGYLGANDNASGVSGLLAIAQAFAEDDAPRRTVIFAAFGAEESGFEGSEAFYTDSASTVDPRDIVHNVNMDMIGSYSASTLVYALGSMAGTPGRTVVDGLSGDYPELDIAVGDWSDQSDSTTFCARGVPYLFFWTEDPDCYHEICDTADRVDYPNLVAIARLTGDTTRALADTEIDLAGAVTAGVDVCGAGG